MHELEIKAGGAAGLFKLQVFVFAMGEGEVAGAEDDGGQAGGDKARGVRGAVEGFADFRDFCGGEGARKA